ncbi:hypothetical protein MRX96_031866 [Rhipicephalus microplus]
MYNKNGTRLGLSFEMGTLYYKLNETTDSLENRPYHPCERFYLTSIDVVVSIRLLSFSLALLCSAPPFVGPDVVVTWEDEESLKYKFYGLQNSTNLREGLSWLLYDVNFGDFSKNCNDNPFTPIEIMKKFASRR